MVRARQATGVVTVALVLAAAVTAGCGGQSALKDPGTPGVEGLREALRSAIEKHDAKAQCELFAPTLIEHRGGSVAACAAGLQTESGPYSQALDGYAAGGRIELSGNRADYLGPPDSSVADAAETTADGFSPTSPVVFGAVYAEGAWKIVPASE